MQSLSIPPLCFALNPSSNTNLPSRPSSLQPPSSSLQPTHPTVSVSISISSFAISPRTLTFYQIALSFQSSDWIISFPRSVIHVQPRYPLQQLQQQGNLDISLQLDSLILQEVRPILLLVLADLTVFLRFASKFIPHHPSLPYLRFADSCFCLDVSFFVWFVRLSYTQLPPEMARFFWCECVRTLRLSARFSRIIYHV